MDLEDLKALACVAEQGSLNKACDVLGVSRTTLRRRLDALEAEFGTALLVRDQTGVSATRAGAAVLERLGPLLTAQEELLRAARGLGTAARAKVRVIVPVGMPQAYQAQLLVQHRALFPTQLVEVIEVPDPLAHLDQPFELMVHFGSPPPQGRWFSRVLHRIRLQAFASPAYLASAGVPERAEQLAGHALLHWRAEGLPDHAWPLRAGGMLEIEPWCASANVVLLGRVTAEGGGIVLAPDDLALLSPMPGPLEPVLVDDVGGELPVRILSPEPTEVDPQVRELLRLMQDAIADLPTA